MSSTLAVSLHEQDPKHHQPRNDSRAASPNDRDSVSPNTINHFETPGASSSAVSCYSDFEEDPFLGAVDFGNPDGAPSFLQDEYAGFQPSATFTNFNNSNFHTVEPLRHVTNASYPLTPDQTASIHTPSPRIDDRRTLTRPVADTLPTSISPQELQKPFKPEPIITQAPQWTPSQSSSARTSEDGLAPARPSMQSAQSPRVTVSNWDQDDNAPTQERTLGDSPTTMRGGFSSAGDLISSSDQYPTQVPRDGAGRWQADASTGQAGVGPRDRTTEEVPTSINDLAKTRKSDERNEEVGQWLSSNLNEPSVPGETHDLTALEKMRYDSNDNIAPGDTTENARVPGQTYYDPNGGQMNDQDRAIIAGDRVWGDAPVMPRIMPGVPGRFQPETAAAAMQRFEAMCRDTDSILSRQATWGTRRRSIHSTADIDVDGILSGNFLKKLSISKSSDMNTKAENLLKEVRGFIRRPSISKLRKRRGSNASNASNVSDDGQQDRDMGQPLEKRDSAGSPHLAPPSRQGSWGKKVNPSINTSLDEQPPTGTNHARKKSVGAMSMTSPANFFKGLKVENTLQRPRSRSEVPKPSASPESGGSHPNIFSLLKATGGPPVASLSRTSLNTADPEDDDDDDDELQEDMDMKAEANLIDGTTPNFAGFQQHVITLNPHMDGQFNFLVDRIAQQQIVRYKTLLGLRVKHLGLGANCPCGPLCIALGGQAKVLEQKTDPKSVDPIVNQLADDDDEGNTPIDGAINQDSFPQDIPMPPTQYLPAEYECQLCFSSKEFKKPSDWTKHVHEDVQPFTCTWERCRDAKSFKRKADWVRHENEGHRHLEWWRCNVEECRHTCYRRDNFLQHLVREHKFPEPKAKTKAAIKKSGGADPTWRKVEECHENTGVRPQDEPCRFCGKTFPTWKKLTVHLAKHMEQISLPVLRLVAAKAKEISADTIISPVQDPPQRPAFNYPMVPNPNSVGAFPNNDNQIPASMGYQDPGSYNMYPVMPQGQPYGGQGYYPNQYDSMGQSVHTSPLTVDTMNQGFNQGHMQSMPVSSAGYDQGSNGFMAMPNNNIDSALEPFPQLQDSGLQDTGLGLHSAAGSHLGTHMGYNMMDHSAASASPYSGHGSASPYGRSPHQNANGADHQGWDDRHMSGY